MWKNYVNFSDRTDLRGYWMAFLINFLAVAVLSLLANVLPALAFISGLYGLAVLVPSLAIAVRRLRDTGKEWYWILVGLIPVVGWIILIVLLCGKSA